MNAVDFPIGLIRWDGFIIDPDPSWAVTAGFPALKAKFGYRQPKNWDPNFALASPTPAVVDTQRIMDAEILDAAPSRCFWIFDNFPRAVDLLPDVADASQIQIAFDAYMASPHKHLMKFAVLLDPFWLGYPSASYAHFTLQQLPYLVSLIKDPQYQRAPDGRPIVFFFGLLNETTFPMARWNEFKAAVGEPLFGVSATHSNSSTTTYGLSGESAYGPTNLPAGSGRVPWSAQFAADKSIWPAIPGAQPLATMTPTQDQRPVHPTSVYVDLPTMPEWQQEIREARAFRQLSGGARAQFGVVYAHDEVAEGGPFIAIQEIGTPGTVSRFYKELEWENQAFAPPDSYAYQVSACNAGGAVARTGTGWAEFFPDPAGIPGAHQGDEEVSSTAGDTMVFTHPALNSIQIFATTGPDRGQLTVQLDAGAIVHVDLYAATSTVHASIWSSGALDKLTHSVTVVVLGTKNPLSSNVQVGIDSFGPDYDPSRT